MSKTKHYAENMDDKPDWGLWIWLTIIAFGLGVIMCNG